MAFTFLVEDGTGLAESNSYASIEEADDYWEINIHEQEWPSLADETKEKLLAHATRLLEERIDWSVAKGSTTQALTWPTSEGHYHPDGTTPIEVDEIPDAVVTATILYARSLISAEPTNSTATEGLRRVEVDVIELEFDPDARIKRLPDLVSQILAGYGREKGSGARYGIIKRR